MAFKIIGKKPRPEEGTSPSGPGTTTVLDPPDSGKRGKPRLSAVGAPPAPTLAVDDFQPVALPSTPPPAKPRRVSKPGYRAVDSILGGPKGGRKFDVAHTFVREPQEAKYAPFPASVSPAVRDLLTMGGTRTPYCHQAEVAHLILDEGKNVSLRTPTASGKTVSFLAPTLTLLERDENAVALMLYPMNALAADQLKGLVDLGFKMDQRHHGIGRLNLNGREIVVGVLNGDTPDSARKVIRERADMILTNPVALHTSILSQATHRYADGTRWDRVLRNIKMVVVDEGHTQSGVGGTHTALAFRRLLAQLDASGSPHPKAIIASATIGNPVEHAQKLTGLSDWASVDKSGAKTQERTVVVLSPVEMQGKGKRFGVSPIISDLALRQVEYDRPTIVFCQSRNATERVADRLNDSAQEEIAVAFHSAIPPAEKRSLTERVLRGDVPVVAATSALEVGVDIGGMETAVLWGHPGDNASFDQRIGRVGRTSPGVVYLVLDENLHPMNTYLLANPQGIHGLPESRVIYPENKVLSARHAACAYLETRRNEDLVQALFPGVDMDRVKDLAAKNPHGMVNMLGGIGDYGQFSAIAPEGEDGAHQVIQRLGGQDALLNWHPGAVLRSARGTSFRVKEVDRASLKVFCEPLPDDVARMYSSPVRSRSVMVLSSSPALEIGSGLAGVSDPIVGDFSVREVTAQYRLQTYFKGGGEPVRELIELNPDEMNPPIEFQTRGVQVDLGIDNPLADAILGLGPKPEVNCDAVADVMKRTIPLVVEARPEDVDLEITVLGSQGIRLTAFDLADGGMGWSEAAAPRLKEWLHAAGKLMAGCSCRGNGCPKCTLAPLDTWGQRKDLVDSLLEASKGA